MKLQPLLVLIILFGCSQSDETKTPKSRTLEAWQALQRVDGETDSSLLPELDPTDLRTIPPYIRHFREIATGYSQIDLTDVDPLLAGHIEESISVHVGIARAFEGYYSDLAQLANRLQRDVDSARRFGNFLGGEDAGSAGADIMEFLVRAGSDEEIKQQVQGILANHREELLDALNELRETAASDKEIADKLTRKYSTRFIDVF